MAIQVQTRQKCPGCTAETTVSHGKPKRWRGIYFSFICKSCESTVGISIRAVAKGGYEVGTLLKVVSPKLALAWMKSQEAIAAKAGTLNADAVPVKVNVVHPAPENPMSVGIKE